jgi:hypothetical protein
MLYLEEKGVVKYRLNKQQENVLQIKYMNITDEDEEGEEVIE